MALKIATPPMPGGGKPAGGTLTETKPEAQADMGSERIRLLAYLKWEAAGKPNGDGIRYWLEADAQYSAVVKGAALFLLACCATVVA